MPVETNKLDLEEMKININKGASKKKKKHKNKEHNNKIILNNSMVFVNSRVQSKNDHKNANQSEILHPITNNDMSLEMSRIQKSLSNNKKSNNDVEIKITNNDSILVKHEKLNGKPDSAKNYYSTTQINHSILESSKSRTTEVRSEKYPTDKPSTANVANEKSKSNNEICKIKTNELEMKLIEKSNKKMNNTSSLENIQPCSSTNKSTCNVYVKENIPENHTVTSGDIKVRVNDNKINNHPLSNRPGFSNNVDTVNQNHPESTNQSIIDSNKERQKVDQNNINDLTNKIQLLRHENPTKSNKKEKPKISTRNITRHIFNSAQIFHTDDMVQRDILVSSQVSFVIQDLVSPEQKNAVYCLICHKHLIDVQSIYEHWRSMSHVMQLKFYEQIIHWPMLPENDTIKIFLPLNYIEEQIFPDCRRTKYFCHACNETLQYNEPQQLNRIIFKTHITGIKHVAQKAFFMQKSRKLHNYILWCHNKNIYNVDVYECMYCKVEFNSDVKFISHLNSLKHAQQFYHPATFDGCMSCGVVWCGSPQMFVNHCSTHTIEKSLLKNWFYLPEDARNLILTLNSSVDELIKRSNYVLNEEQEKQRMVLNDLVASVDKIFPNAKAYAFGSREAGLGFPESDIDIFLDCGSAYQGNIDVKEMCGNMKKVETLLNEKTDLWLIDIVIYHCRTPIIKVTHKPTNIKCDISFTCGMGIENTRLIRNYLEAFPLGRQMVLFIKQWLHKCDLHGSKEITNYAITWYVIFYLQTMKILPSVYDLIVAAKKSKIINGWECGVINKILPINSTLSLSELLSGFFIYYAEFNFLHYVACPLIGDIMQKIHFTNLNNLPLSMECYKRYINSSTDSELLRIDSPMCLQDPFDLSHNLTKAVRKMCIYRFKLMAMLSAEVLIENRR